MSRTQRTIADVWFGILPLLGWIFVGTALYVEFVESRWWWTESAPSLFKIVVGLSSMCYGFTAFVTLFAVEKYSCGRDKLKWWSIIALLGLIGIGPTLSYFAFLRDKWCPSISPSR